MRNFNTRHGDYAANNLHCGDCVRLKDDPRHTGVVLSISSGTVQVRWDDTSWISHSFAHTLEKI